MTTIFFTASSTAKSYDFGYAPDMDKREFLAAAGLILVAVVVASVAEVALQARKCGDCRKRAGAAVARKLKVVERDESDVAGTDAG